VKILSTKLEALLYVNIFVGLRKQAPSCNVSKNRVLYSGPLHWLNWYGLWHYHISVCKTSVVDEKCWFWSLALILAIDWSWKSAGELIRYTYQSDCVERTHNLWLLLVRYKYFPRVKMKVRDLCSLRDKWTTHPQPAPALHRATISK